MMNTNIEQKLMMSQKYIVSTAFGTYFHKCNCTLLGMGGWVLGHPLQFWGRSISFKISLTEAKIGKEIQKAL